MKRNPIKQRIRSGELALSMLTSLTDPSVAEIFARAGLDGIIIEMEHSGIEVGRIREFIVASELAGIGSTIRVARGEWPLVQQLLDFGLQGVQVAHISTREHAEEAVDAVRYAPVGTRGAMASSRAAEYGDMPWEEHIKLSNEEIFLNLMIEDLEGIDNLDEIAGLQGVDVVTPGPQDLAEAIGVREPNDPRLHKAIVDLAARLRKVKGAGLGLSIGHPLLPLTVPEVKELGVIHSNVLPPVERQLLVMLRSRINDLRDAEREIAYTSP